MKKAEILEHLDEKVKNFRNLPHTDGLPEDIFLFASRLTPITNVDLLIKDERNRVLLAWRDDEYAGSGWHLPGGIVRFKESMQERVRKVSEIEIGVDVDFTPHPIDFNEIILDHDTRGHFISFLYECFLSSDFEPNNGNLLESEPGFLKWHNSAPQNLVEVHEIYRDSINDK